jgi:hypothetical protein
MMVLAGRLLGFFLLVLVVLVFLLLLDEVGVR